MFHKTLTVNILSNDIIIKRHPIANLRSIKLYRKLPIFNPVSGNSQPASFKFY